MAAEVLAAPSPWMVSRFRIHVPVTVALPYTFPQLLDSRMQGNSADGDLAERDIGNTKKKEEIERSGRSEKAEVGKPTPVAPGLVDTLPKK